MQMCLLRIIFFLLCLSNEVVARVRLGNQVLRDTGFKQLLGKRTAIFSNPTGCYPDTMVHIVDDLNSPTQRAKGVNVVAVFAPEHGFRGDKQAEHGDPDVYIDGPTGLIVYSVYNKSSSTLHDVLKRAECDVIVADLQDVGVRLYTFVWTLFDLLNAASSLGVPVIVLDRPNPLGGLDTQVA